MLEQYGSSKHPELESLDTDCLLKKFTIAVLVRMQARAL